MMLEDSGPVDDAPDPLGKSLARFARPVGPDLLARTEPFFRWQDSRRRAQVWPYSRSLDGAPLTRTTLRTDDGRKKFGLNFASQDYLALAAHPAVNLAVRRALRDFGPHSAGSPILTGNTQLSLTLERALADHLQMEHILLFPTGWAAGFGVIAGLVREADHVVIDQFGHACLQQGAQAATRNVVRHPHLDAAAAEAALADIRRKDTRAGILVVTEGLFSMDSDVPELGALQAACRRWGATLMVDVAHDLGALGPGGTGNLGAQGVLGQVDLVMGSFSKTFATNGGFLATHSPAVKQFVKCYGGPHIFSNALSPLQAAAALEALRLVRSPEGEERRRSLARAVAALRGGLVDRGITCFGTPSPIVPALVPSVPVLRLASAQVQARGLFANLVEYPAVPVATPRFRLQVMADHSVEDAEQAAALVASGIEAAVAQREAKAA